MASKTKRTQKNTADKESGFKPLMNAIKKDSLPSVMLICGYEQYLVKWAVNDIIKRYVNEATASLDFTKLEGPFNLYDIKELCETVSMFSSRRVVLAEDFYYAEGRKRGKGKLSELVGSDEAANDFHKGDLDLKEYMDELCAYLPGVGEDTFLIFTCGEPDYKSDIYKAVDALGGVYEMTSLSKSELRSFIEKRFHQAGKEVRPQALDDIINATGYLNKDIDYSLYNLDNDLNKIIAHARGEYITAEDALMAISGNLELNTFSMLDAISQGRKDEAYRLFFNELASGGDVMPLLGQVINTFERILFVREMRDEGKNMAECATTLGYPPTYYPIKKAWGFSEYYTVKQLRRICRNAYEIDASFKKGLLSESLAMEMFIAQL